MKKHLTEWFFYCFNQFKYEACFIHTGFLFLNNNLKGLGVNKEKEKLL